MNLITLDPSSTCVGFARFADSELVTAHRYVVPQRACKIRALGETAHRIIDAIRAGDVDAIVFETPSPAAPLRSARGQANYGLAVGFFIAWIMRSFPSADYHFIRADEWTRGVRKEKRALSIRHRCPAYALMRDPGLDIADAIGLGLWWLTEQAALRAKARRD